MPRHSFFFSLLLFAGVASPPRASQPSFLFSSLPQLLRCAEQHRFRVLHTLFLWQEAEPDINYNLSRAGAVTNLVVGGRGVLKLPAVGGIDYTAQCKSITQRPAQ